MDAGGYVCKELWPSQNRYNYVTVSGNDKDKRIETEYWRKLVLFIYLCTHYVCLQVEPNYACNIAQHCQWQSVFNFGGAAIFDSIFA